MATSSLTDLTDAMTDFATTKSTRTASTKSASRTAAAAAARSATASLLTVPAGTTYKRPNGDEYRVRFVGDHADVPAIVAAAGAGAHTIVDGVPGTGKTALIEAAAVVLAEAGSDGERVPYEVVQGNESVTAADIIGSWKHVFDPAEGTRVWRWFDGPLLRALTANVPLYVDEIALIPEAEIAVLYPVMDGRGYLEVEENPDLGRVPVPEDFWVAASCNSNLREARLSPALRSRFKLHIQVGTDYDLAQSLGVPADAVKIGRNLSARHTAGEVDWAPSLRDLLNFRDVATTLGERVAASNLIGAAPEFDRHVVAEVVGSVIEGVDPGPLSLGGQV